MKRAIVALKWTIVALALALFAVPAPARADDQPRSKNKGGQSQSKGKGGGGGNANNNNNSNINNSGGGNPVSGGENRGNRGNKSGGDNKHGGAGLNLIPNNQNLPGKNPTGNVEQFRRNNNNNNNSKFPGGVSGGKSNNKPPSKANWNNWNKDGWNKNAWNNNFNSQHQRRRHGYWNNGVWIAPWIIAYNQPWTYLRPVQPIVVGQKWLGVTYEPYDGGGAYITGIYEGSPAQQVGLEVGDVIVSIDGMDATNLPAAIQASDGNVTLQVLSGRTGDLVQAQVNLIR